MWRYFTYTRKKRYVDTLDDLALSYNNNKQQTMRMSPSDVTTNDELDLLRDMYNIPVPREPKKSFRVGDSVCITMTRRPLKNRIHWSMVRRVICRVGKASCDSNHLQGKRPG